MTVKALKIEAMQIKRVSVCINVHCALRFLTELFCVGVNNWVKELAASDVIEVEREKVRSFWSRLGIQYTNAPSNR
jgi:hypothetical protein